MAKSIIVRMSTLTGNYWKMGLCAALGLFLLGLYWRSTGQQDLPVSSNFLMPHEHKVKLKPGKYEVWLYPFWGLYQSKPEMLDPIQGLSPEALRRDIRTNIEFSLKSAETDSPIPLKKYPEFVEFGEGIKLAVLVGSINVERAGTYLLKSNYGYRKFVLEIAAPGAEHKESLCNTFTQNGQLEQAVELD